MTISANPNCASASGTPHRWPVLWAAFGSYLIDSYDLMVLAIAMPVLLQVLNISLPEGGLLGSATMVGAMLGSVLFGLLAENRGRRFALVTALLWLGVTMALVYFVNRWGEWMLLRAITGLAIGGLWGPCAALTAAHWHPRYRGRAAAFVFSSFAIGAMLAALTGRLVLSTDWRILFLLGVASIPLALVVLRLVPPDRQTAPQPGSAPAEGVGIGAIFADGLGKTTVLATLVSLFNLAGYWGAAIWFPTFLKTERGLNLQTMADYSLVMYVGMFFGFLAFGALSDRIGRRAAMILAFLTTAFSVALYLVVQDLNFLFWWGAVVGFGLCGVGGVLGSYYTELFPERLRAYAGGFCWNMGRIGAIAAPYVIGAIGKAYGLQIGLAVTCGIFICGAATLLFLPETLRTGRQMESAPHTA